MSLAGAELELLEAARRGDEDRLCTARRPSPRPSCTPTATACWRRHRMPRTPCRRRCCAPGAACPRFERRSSLRSWLYTIATNACLKAIERRRQARVLPIDYGPPPIRTTARRGRWSSRSGSSPIPTRGLGLEDWAAPEARYEQRESIELAFIAALQQLPAAPAGDADPARRARLLGPRDRPQRSTPRPRLGQQRAAARAPAGRRAAARAEPAGDAAAARRRRAERDRRAVRRRLGARRRRRGGLDAGRGRHDRHAADPDLVRRARADRRLPARVRARPRRALAPRADVGATASRRSPTTSGTSRRLPSCRTA